MIAIKLMRWRLKQHNRRWTRTGEELVLGADDLLFLFDADAQLDQRQHQQVHDDALEQQRDFVVRSKPVAPDSKIQWIN